MPPVDCDPLASHVTDEGYVIDLSTPTPTLVAELTHLGKREQRVKAMGAACELMHTADHDCSTRCPLYTESADDPRHRLCSIGVRQYEIGASLDRRGTASVAA